MDAHRARAVIVVLATGIAGCHHSSTPPKGDPVPREAFVDTSVRETCAALESCCSSRGFRFNAEACAANVRLSDFDADEPTTFCPAPALYDAHAAGNCIAERKAAFSSCALDPSSASESCRRVCKGTVAAGQTCTSDTDCAEGETGLGLCYPASETGKCLQSLRGKTGDLCNMSAMLTAYGDWRVLTLGSRSDGPWAECRSEDGLFCAGGATSQQPTCQPFLGIGKPCTDSVHTFRNEQAVAFVGPGRGDLCAPELYCSEGGSCVARKRSGEPCTDDDQCLDFVCGSTSRRCLPAGVQDITAEFCADPA